MRIHKVILGNGANYLDALVDRGRPVPALNVAAKAVAAQHQPYSEVCLECHQVDAQADPRFALPVTMLILRGTVACACCCPPCRYPGHSPQSALDGVMQHVPSMEPMDQGYRCHGPGRGYAEAVVGLDVLEPLWTAAQKGDAKLGKEIETKATEFGLDGADLTALAGDYHALDAAAVFAGNAAAEDYFFALALVVLWQRAIFSAHRVLGKDWPQRTKNLKPR